jgi:hypothetical protein
LSEEFGIRVSFKEFEQGEESAANAKGGYPADLLSKLFPNLLHRN